MACPAQEELHLYFVFPEEEEEEEGGISTNLSNKHLTSTITGTQTHKIGSRLCLVEAGSLSVVCTKLR